MNIAFWILQVLWGVSFCITGFGKLVCFRTDIWNRTLHQPVPWFSAIPQGLFVFIGVCEFLGGLGLILPAMTRVRPKLTPLAAIGLTLVMVLAALFHLERGGEYNFLQLNLVSVAITAFIAYGRLLLKPIAASSISTLRLLSELAVLGALVLVSAAPVWYWYMLSHAH
ncbi:MAG TPA: DoxX family protein [Verrucomicrobiae bacterium]|nr:DoxX family protein [Verrucomicrobiae bacterium]